MEYTEVIELLQKAGESIGYTLNFENVDITCEDKIIFIK